jgi:hypothetical protein
MKSGERRGYLKLCKTKHHINPKGRRKYSESDLTKIKNSIVLKLWSDKHCELHKIFGHLSLDEIIEVLQRVNRMKHRQFRSLKRA